MGALVSHRLRAEIGAALRARAARQNGGSALSAADSVLDGRWVCAQLVEGDFCILGREND